MHSPFFLPPATAVDYKQEIPWGGEGLGEFVASRTYQRLKADGVKETWPEATLRAVNGAQHLAVLAGFPYTEDELTDLWKLHLDLRAFLPGRMLWVGGTELVADGNIDPLMNCWHVTLREAADFGWVMERLMVGGGVGFTIDTTGNLPLVHPAQVTHVDNPAGVDYAVPDTREGWAELMSKVVDAYVTGTHFTFSTFFIRPLGAPLKRFGGFASGPGVLVEGIQDICRILDARAGMFMRPVDALDITNIIGRIVIAGSSRRSAQIAIGSPYDPEYLAAKRWADGVLPAWRSNSNNSVAASSFAEIPNSFWASYYDGGGEPYGLVNVPLAQRYGRLSEEWWDSSITGFNPCAESTLGDREPCMLATLVLPRLRTFEEAARASWLLYKFQKAAVSGWHHDERTHEIMQRNRRIGQNVTGILSASREARGWLDPLYTHLRHTDEEFSRAQGIPDSVRLTTVQPGGTLPLLPGVSAGIHPSYADNYIRRVMVGIYDPLVGTARSRGLNVVPKIGLDGAVDPTHMVVEFPCKGEGITTRHMSAVDQLEWQRWANTMWSDQAVSCTVSYKPEELPEIRTWLSQYYDSSVKSVSFLRYEDHGFLQAPYEEITVGEYETRSGAVNAASLRDSSSDLLIDSCVSGACPVR